MAIKAILLDIDGTLTNDEKKITPRTRDALLKAQEMGIRLVIASGRPPKGITPYGNILKMEENHGLYVCFNGAKVLDCETGEELVNTTLDTELAREILHHVKQFNVRPMIVQGDYMVVEDVYDCMINDGDRRFNVIEYESRMNNYILKETSDIENAIEYPLNKILTAGDSDYMREVSKELAAPFEGRASSMFTANFFYEYTALGIDKGNSLAQAMEKIGILPEECIAFGDAENDISMLKFAGVGVCMANGQDKVKEAADLIADDNNHDGIVKVLAQYIPGLED